MEEGRRHWIEAGARVDSVEIGTELLAETLECCLLN